MDILKDLKCSNAFENPLQGEYLSENQNFTYVEIDLIPCYNKPICKNKTEVDKFFEKTAAQIVFPDTFLKSSNEVSNDRFVGKFINLRTFYEIQ